MWLVVNSYYLTICYETVVVACLLLVFNIAFLQIVFNVFLRSRSLRQFLSNVIEA